MKNLGLLTLTLLAICAFWPTALSAQSDFSEKEKTLVYTHSMQVLEEFQRLVNEIGVSAVSDMEAAQSSSEAFLELFVNRQVLVYNDLDPAHQLSPFYEAETYISNLLLWYPDGIDIDLGLDQARAGSFTEHGDGVYSLDILLTKKINGNYLNRSQNQNSEELLYRIAFNRRSSGSYKIVGIRSAGADFEIDHSQALEEVNAEELNENQLAQVEDGVRGLLNDYINLLSLLADPDELEEDRVFYREAFLELFNDRASLLFNDLEPDPENYLLASGEYLDLYRDAYSGGVNNLSMNIDSTRVGQVVQKDDGSYQVSAGANKFFSGMYREEEAIRDMFALNFQFVFERSGSAFVHFRIESVDIDAEDFYAATGEAEAFVMPDQEMSTLSRKGLSLSFHASFGQSHMPNLDLPPDGTTDTWDLVPGYGFGAGVELQYFFSDHLGLITGLSLEQYQGTYSLVGQFEDTEFSQDVNGDDYYKNLVMELDSSLMHFYVGLPLLLNYTSCKPGKTGFYLDAGIRFSYRASSSYEVAGDEKMYGRYPGSPIFFNDTTSLPELGFYDRENVYRTGSPELSNINLSAYLSAGIVIPLGYFSSIRLGPEVLFGISDINKGYDTRNIYGRVVPHERTALRKYGIRIKYVLKL